MWGLTGEGGMRGGTAVGGALRNAWKVSAKSWRLWTDNPPRHITMPSPTRAVVFLSLVSQTI